MIRPHTVLEDVGRVEWTHNGLDVWSMEESRVVPESVLSGLYLRVFVVDFPMGGAGSEFLLGRHLCGMPKYDLVRRTAHEMIGAFGDWFSAPPVQYIILWGGRPMDLLGPGGPIFPDSLIPTTYVKLSRVEDAQRECGWSIETHGMIGPWREADDWIVMEECIASGSTVEAFAREAFRHVRPKRLFLFPVCGSGYGIRGIGQVCKENGVELVVVYNTAVIDVAVQGVRLPYTDLGLQPGTLMTRAFAERAMERYQGKPICWVGDIGDSLYSPVSYLLETLDDMELLDWDYGKEPFSEWPKFSRSLEFRRQVGARFPKVLPIFDALAAADPACSG